MNVNSKNKRLNPLFMRNQFKVEGKFGIHLVKKQDISLQDISLIACSDTQSNASDFNKQSGVNVIKLRIDSYQGIQTKCMPFCATGSRLYVMSTGA